MCCLHKKGDYLQRMINACLKGTYFAPHKSEGPQKLKIFTILKGRAAVIYFDDSGEIKECAVLDEKGPVRAAEVPPLTWCSMVILSERAVFFEIVTGEYNPKTHKHFAPWAPLENDANASAYLEELEDKINLHI